MSKIELDKKMFNSITLVDFKNDIPPSDDDDDLYNNNTLFSKFKDKMRTRKRHGFSMNFNQVHIIPKIFGPSSIHDPTTNISDEDDDSDHVDHSEHSFRAPSDVKISHTHQVIIVSDYSNMKLYFFRYTDKTFIGSVNVDHPMYLCIEEKYNGWNDALIFDANSNLGTVFKFDLYKMLQTIFNSELSFSRNDFIWKNGDARDARGMAMMRDLHASTIGDHQLLFVSDFTSNDIFLINSKTGVTIQKFQDLMIECPYAIDVCSENRMVIISEYTSPSSIYMMKLEHTFHQGATQSSPNYTLKLIKKFDKKGDDEIHDSCQGLVFDNVTQHIYCTDTECRIQVFNLQGQCIKSLDTRMDETSDNPDGLCLDDKTGELYLCSYYAACIRIYK